jgi:hypothetical protein
MTRKRQRDGNGNGTNHNFYSKHIRYILTKMGQFEDTWSKNWLKKSLIKRFFTLKVEIHIEICFKIQKKY